MELKKYKLGDIAEIIVGFPFESEKFNIEGHGVRLVRGMNVSERYLRFGEDARWWNEISDKLRPYYLQENDILIGMDGSKVGKNFALVKKEDLPLLLVQRVACIRAKKGFDQRFIWHYVSSPRFVEYVNTIKTGSAIPHISSSQIGNFPIYTPLLEEQEKIASILSALDDKIALNHAINQNLEALAKQLYDYWFVQFDFPNEEGKLYKSSGGKMVWNEKLKRNIPANWDIAELGNTCEILLGGTPDTGNEAFWGGLYPWLNSGEVAEFPIIKSEKTITQKGLNSSSTAYAPKGSVTLSITRHLRPSILAIDACINQSVVAIKETKEVRKEYLYPLINREIPRFMKLRTGAQQPHINKETVEKTWIVIPSSNVLCKYYKIVSPIYSSIIENALEKENLTKQRDELLPLLMNGQVTID